MSPADECKDGDCSTGSMCFKHKIRTIQWSPSCTPSRRNTIPPKAPNNAWERGIAKDERGMPLLDSNCEPIGLKEMANKRGHYERQLRDLKNTPPTPTPHNATSA